MTTDKALRAWVVGRYGEGSPQAIAFGFPPRKKPGRSVADKSHAVAQAKATRVARNTMGKKQKEKIRDVLPGDAPADATVGATVSPRTTAAPTTLMASPVVAPPVAAAPVSAVNVATNGVASAH